MAAVLLGSVSAMKPEKIKNEIGIPESIDTHVLGWKIQRIGWLIFTLLLVAAGMGLFGNGPVSYRTEIIQNDTLRYQKFIRYQTEANLSFVVNSEQTNRLKLQLSYLKNFDLQQISPEPKSTKISGGFVVYDFDISGPAQIDFVLTPNTYGNVGGSAQVENKSFLISQFIYP